MLRIPRCGAARGAARLVRPKHFQPQDLHVSTESGAYRQDVTYEWLEADKECAAQKE